MRRVSTSGTVFVLRCHFDEGFRFLFALLSMVVLTRPVIALPNLAKDDIRMGVATLALFPGKLPRISLAALPRASGLS